MKTSSIARRYAKAIFELAVEQSAHEAVARELRGVLSAFESDPEVGVAMMSPVLSADQKLKVIDALAAQSKLSELTANTLRLLAQRGRLGQLPALVDRFDELVDEKAGRLRARVVTAIKLPEEDAQRIASGLQAATKKQVAVERSVDPAILGGVVAQVGSTIYDGSLRSQLADMARQLKGSR